jgi:hypothetical protein
MIKNILLYGILLVGVLANAQSIALVSTKNNNYVTLENKTEQVQPNYIKVNDLNYQSFTKQFQVVLD